MNVIQTKEAWIEARMQEIQRLRLALQKGYVTKLRSNRALLGRTYRGEMHEEEFFWGEEVQEDTPRDEVPSAIGAPTRRKGKRRADESELVNNAPRKRLRNAV